MSIFFLQQTPFPGGKILLFLIFLIILIVLFIKSSGTKTTSIKNISFSFLRKFSSSSRKTQVGIIILFLMIFGYLIKVSGIDKPSVCECKNIGYEYSIRELTRDKYAYEWSRCKDYYKEEISKWVSSYSGPCYHDDWAVCYFANSCK